MPIAGNDPNQGASAVDQQLNSYRTKLAALRGNVANSEELTEALNIGEALLKMLDNTSNQADIAARAAALGDGINPR